MNFQRADINSWTRQRFWKIILVHTKCTREPPLDKEKTTYHVLKKIHVYINNVFGKFLCTWTFWQKLLPKLAQISIQITKINLVWFLIYSNVLFVEPFHYYIYWIKCSLKNVCIIHVKSIYKVCYINIIICVLLISLFNQISCLMLKKSFSVMRKKEHPFNFTTVTRNSFNHEEIVLKPRFIVK